jgi:hypothetical protein
MQHGSVEAVCVEPSDSFARRNTLSIEESVDSIEDLLVGEVHTFLVVRLALLMATAPAWRALRT